jgi:diguanylate cyclase (GGDEF)-like protein/PAS domain S-box-containing protein
MSITLKPIPSVPSITNSRTARMSLLCVSALLLALFVLASAALVHVAMQQNAAALNRGQFYVQKAIQAREKAMLATISDYAYWGDAYQHLHASVDSDWAYKRQNLGRTLFDNFTYEGVFVVDPRGHTTYAVVDGALVSTPAEQWLGQDIEGLLQRAREQTVDEEPLAEFLQVGGHPALVAATGFTRGGDLQIAAVPGPASVLVFVDMLDGEKLEALGHDYGIKGLRLSRDAADAAAKPFLRLAGDDSLTLRWDPEQPGRQLLYMILPLVFIAGVIIAIVTLVILRRALATTRQMDANFASLQASQSALAASEARFRDVAEAASDWIWEIDAGMRFTYLSERFQAVTGWPASQWLGRHIDELLCCAPLFAESLSKTIGRTTPEVRQCAYRAQDDHWRTCRVSLRPIDNADGTCGFRGTASDITEEVEARARIEHLSQHDALTGLPNRNRMQEFLDGKLKALPSVDNPLVMLSLDLDRFKPINDALGHSAGDQVLNEVSQRLRQYLRDDDLVARLGGDEFILIISGISTQREVERLCERLIARIEQPFVVGDNQVFISASIGVAMAPADAVQAEELLRYADIALYEAKGAGRKTWRFYASNMNERVVERRQLEGALRNGLKQDELRLMYQPRYHVDSGRMAGAEALVRWQHPQRGLLGPDLFIGIAEEAGLISALSDWVMHRACLEATAWSEALIVSVNLSPLEFQRGKLVERVRSVLDATGLAPQRLELELTESVMLDDAEGALAIMHELKALGVRLAMDDFGTGYSSLSYLRAYPFDVLKIDRSFMLDLEHSAGSQAIIQAIVGLGRALSLTITAEGVETQEQLEILRRVDCHEAQGYYLNRPLQPEQLRLAMSRTG